jgi:hypothetical protein
MTNMFEDERIRFFLRNREDIKAWAAIETDVMAATRELLASSQPLVEERLLAIDPVARVGRHDSGPWERIIARHEHWPSTVGLALEWNRAVDPLGANRPKVGVFWWADPPTLVAPRTRLTEVVAKKALQDQGYKIPLESVWPIGTRVTSKPDWWQDPEGWVSGIVDSIAFAWPLIHPAIDAVLQDVEWQVSVG